MSPITPDHRHNEVQSPASATPSTAPEDTVVHPGVEAVGRHDDGEVQTAESEHAGGPGEDSSGGDDREKNSEQRELTEDEKREVGDLKKRDAEVRRHEAAHAAAGGAYAGSPSFEYQVGPDGKRYAVGGEVSIDASAVPGDPQRTIAKMQAVQRAATAPESPSSQDRRVAAEAAQNEQKARQELVTELREKATARLEEREEVTPEEDSSAAEDEEGTASEGDDEKSEATPSAEKPHGGPATPTLPAQASARAHAAIANARAAFAERFGEQPREQRSALAVA